MRLALCWFFLFLVGCSGVYGHEEYFNENLKISSLQDGRVSTTFSFETILKGVPPRDPRLLNAPDSSQHYIVFPLALGQILREYAVTELHLTLNAGSWNYERWGYPEESGVGTGAELWAWMGAGAPMSIDDRWQGLRNALAGLFCASLGTLDEQRTTSPTHSYFPHGILPSWNGSSAHELRHGSMPSEHVCTENLTPFLKLLPCKSLSGIASLLNPHRIFDADWHGLGIHVLWSGESGIKVRLSFQGVMDPLRPSISQKRDWSLESLFSRSIERSCPAANSSNIYVTLPSEAYNISPEPSKIVGQLASYDILGDKSFNVAMKWPRSFQYSPSYETSVPISVVRTLRGATQASGKLSLVISNHRSTPQSLVYLETMPWLVQFQLHTLHARVDGRIRDDVISNISYMAPVPHSRPATFQAELRLAPRSVTHLTMDVDKAFLRYTEHPPDAQRGWDLPPAVLIPILSDTEDNHTRSSNRQRLGQPIYTSTLLVDVATPDFSMPYNVIIFTCSLIAFIFGSVFNLLTRKFVVIGPDQPPEK
ncbi:hypothetical protein Agabi119p4_7119 [Agaricus bisporus var. burnettii]|uniref:GPI transamidase component PIG-T n=1 Tax=Agaricus bisporus var. burnettii TaxID=192524 RepID=A0A8H7C6M4_AGABI|nr:hypothetical protein Agabi119p4_7119 [Agaricus bisporus var. burnettii]